MTDHNNINDIELFRSILKTDLMAFTTFLFQTLYPDKKFEENWHHLLIAHQLQRCADGENLRLIINQPPRTAKSTFASIAFPLWLLLKDPTLEILCISYGDELGRQFAEQARRFINHPRVQMLFPGVWINGGRNNEIRTRSGGRRYTLSAGGAITGQGADIIIIDDPLKASDAGGKARHNINSWFDDNIYQRLNTKNTGRIILVQQRLHVDDLSGYLTNRPGDWKHLVLSAIAEEDETWKLPGNKTLFRKVGEALHPELESLEKLESIKMQMGSYTFEAQYQQHPASPKEALLKEEWFQSYQNHEIQPYGYSTRFFEATVQAWDTASTISDTADYSVCVTMGRSKGKYYVIDVWRGQLEFPALINKVAELYSSFKPNNVLIEDAGSGRALIQALRENTIPIQDVRPDGSKVDRLASVSGIVNSGFVFLPENTFWKQDFLLELCRFPNVRHDDQVDAFAYALNHLRDYTPFVYANIR